MHSCPAQIRVVNWGRKTGKTWAVAYEVVVAAMGGEGCPRPLVWVVAPTYKQAAELFRDLRGIIHGTELKQFVARATLNPMMFELRNGGTIEIHSADDPDTLRGPNVHFLVLEEAAQMSDYAVNSVLMPSLAVTRGRAIMISTPKGKNWFYHRFLAGLDPLVPNTASFHATCYDNPYVDQAFVESEKARFSGRHFAQEYLAEFLADGGEVFRRVRECTNGSLALPVEPIPGKRYTIGVDWAKYHDFTVMTVLDVHSRKVVAWDRFNHLDYNIQISRLADLAKTYNQAYVLMDASNESSLVDICMTEGIRNVEGFKFTYESKKNVVDALVVGIERGELTIPNIPQLIAELEAFEYTKTNAGNIRAAAPEGEGYYDDCVISLALAWYHARNRSGGGVSHISSAMSGTRVA